SLYETETETDTETPYDILQKAEDYADLDFGGKAFKIIYRWEPPEEKPSGWGFYFDLYEDADNPDDILTAAVALRRNAMKMFYNCDVVGVPSISASGEAATAINTGAHEYDLVLAQYMLTGYGTSKLYFNLLPMLNRSYDCWDDALIRDYSFANKLYGVTGDLSISDDECLLVMLFNKDILSEHNIEYPYDLVRSGKWTLDKMIEMSRLCATDVNGNGEYDTTGDIFGTVMWADCWEFLYVGCGGRFISPVKEDGTVDWAGNALGYEADIYALCVEYLNDPTTGGIKPSIGVPNEGTEIVGSGRAAFFLSQLSNITSTKQPAFRDYENYRFGIVPVPKWNEDQTSYYSTFSVNIGLYAAPITGDYKTISDFLNVYALSSQPTVQKAYTYSIAYSHASDANVEEMLNIANAGRVWDYSLYTEATVNSLLTSDCKVSKIRWSSRLQGGEKKIMASAETVTKLYAENPN
ncbi:MAG: hypothetical protein J5940_02715, partial [Clostridia bacterium]|nr:hypothetical protein [Clostridia bacterium]